MDAIAALQMLFPQLLLKSFGIRINADAEFTYAMRYGAPLMVGWTGLLFWAERKPVERRDVLLITLTAGISKIPKESRGYVMAMLPRYTNIVWGWPYRFLRKVSQAGAKF